MKTILPIILLLASLAAGQSTQPINLIVPPGTSVVITVSAPATQPAQPATQPAYKMAIGTNAPSNDYINGSAAWCDVTHKCTGWNPAGNAKITQYDANGYPAVVTGGQAASFTYLLGDPSGPYKLYYNGPQNALSILGKSFTSVSDGAGGWTATVNFNSGERCEFRSTGGVSVIRLLTPDAKPNQVYRDAFLNLFKGYTVLRLMPQERVNGVGFPPVLRTDWTKRTTATSWDQTTNEVAPELQAELCKETNLIPWVCVPYNAPDAYVVGLVKVFADAGFKVIRLSQSNELWNTGPQYQGMQIRNDAIALGTYGSTDPNVAGARRDGQLTAHMGAVAKTILPGTLVTVDGQAAWSAWLSDAASYMKPGDAQIGAVAPYFQPVDSSSNNVAGILASCDQWIATVTIPGLAANYAVCQKNGWAFEGYESGESLVSQNPGALPPVALLPDSAAQTAAFNADPMTLAQFDPQMGVLTTRMLTVCQAGGMTMNCYFMAISNWGRSGYWGLFQTPGDKPNPKSQAIANWMRPANE